VKKPAANLFFRLGTLQFTVSSLAAPYVPDRCEVVPASKSFCRPRLARTERSTPSTLLIVDLIVLAAIVQMVLANSMLRLDRKSSIRAD
jgi:hypothetical protein